MGQAKNEVTRGKTWQKVAERQALKHYVLDLSKTKKIYVYIYGVDLRNVHGWS